MPGRLDDLGVQEPTDDLLLDELDRHAVSARRAGLSLGDMNPEVGTDVIDERRFTEILDAPFAERGEILLGTSQGRGPEFEFDPLVEPAAASIFRDTQVAGGAGVNFLTQLVVAIATVRIPAPRVPIAHRMDAIVLGWNRKGFSALTVI